MCKMSRVGFLCIVRGLGLIGLRLELRLDELVLVHGLIICWLRGYGCWFKAST